MKFLRKELKGMVPYHSKYITDGVILNGNESPFNVPDKILELFKKELQNINFNRYPDMDNTILREAISKAYNVNMNNVTCGVGSDEILDILFKSVVSKGEYVGVLKPSFSMYKEFAKLHDVNVLEASCNIDFSFNLDNVLNMIRNNDIKMLILCNPNNPTGAIIKHNEIIKILDIYKGLLVIDEAYMEFYSEGEIDLINKYNNVLILRTFSKLYALASMRCGYAIGCKDVIDVIDTAKSPYNLNEVTLRLASVVIKNKDLYKERILYFKSERKRIYDILKELNIEVYESHSNFLWMKLSDKIIKALDDNKIYIRKMKYNDIDYQRICIGTKEENELLLKVVRENA